MVNEKFNDRNIAEIAKEYSLLHGSAINIARISPNLIDGLKLVARRLLYIMYLKDQGKKYRKVVAITGDTASRIHHHGSVSIYSTLVGLAQPWNNNLPLIDKVGNYGSVSGDEPGAERYIEARLSEYALDCFFDDWSQSTVDMVIGADNETYEPLYLPAKYPNILINGLLGIGYGLSSQIPAYSFKEVIETTILLMKDPLAKFMLIPDSPTGCDIVAGNFEKICETGSGIYTMRCTYDIVPDSNQIIITSLPYQVMGNFVRDKIADIKQKGGLPELINMQDHSGEKIEIHLYLHGSTNPYKFIGKLIDQVAGLERSYPVTITVVEDYKLYDLSIRQLLVEWIRYRREQKRTTVNHRRTTLLAEQRTNDVKIFILDGNNLEDTVNIFRSSRNRSEIEKRLIERYHITPIRMDSLQARTLSEMRMVELTTDSHDRYLSRRDEILKELEIVNDILNQPDGIDQVIIDELKSGIKKFGKPRKSNVVPYRISSETEVPGECVLQLSVDGMVLRRPATNVDDDPIPIDPNGFAVKVENESSFVAIDENGYFSMLKVKELPVDTEVPLNRFIRDNLGKIIVLAPYTIDGKQQCILISALGMIKKIRISDMKPSKKPCIELKGDKLVRGIISRGNTSRDILIFTDNGYGQRLDPNIIRTTSYQAKGSEGFKLESNDSIVGCYFIDPKYQYLLYITSRGKGRLNQTKYLPLRKNKHDDMVKLISIPDRDHLLAVCGCDKNDQLQVFYQDSSQEIIDISKIPEGTMSSSPIKIVNRSMVSNRIIKIKII